MEFPDRSISAYAETFTSAESDLLKRINRETWSQVLMPRMLSGHLQGRILSMISKMLQPQRILEIGTYTGYSALCLAEGLQAGGELHTIDINDELEERVKAYFSASAYSAQLHLHIGAALEVIDRLEGPWDMVLIDADKENYANYFDAVIDQVRAGGWIIADNVLWSGKVLDELELMDTETAALHAYNAKVAADARVESLLLPVRDGLMCCRKR